MSKKKRECTIDGTLFQAWKKMRRQGDSVKLCKILNLSRPTVDAALNNGYITDSEVVPKITKFFQDRLLEEKESAKKLMEAATVQTPKRK